MLLFANLKQKSNSDILEIEDDLTDKKPWGTMQVIKKFTENLEMLCKPTASGYSDYFN